MIAGLLLVISFAAAAAAEPRPGVKILTQNLNPGTDLQYIVATGGSPLGVDQTRAEIIASGIPARADLIATHLQSPVEGIPVATEVQVAQASELLRSVRNVTVPVVLCGDFNSDAAFGNGPDATPTVNLITAAGYAECWNLVHPNAGDPGYTWPFYLQDMPAPSYFLPWEPFERIDLFFAKGIDVIGMNRIIAPAPAGTMPPCASDHAGVVATFRL